MSNEQLDSDTKGGGEVYFFHNGDYAKIGYSTQELRKRLWQAHVWSPHELTIVGWIWHEFPDVLEKTVHLHLAHAWMRKVTTGNGEWFNITVEECKKTISNYKNGKIICISGWGSAHSTAYRHPAHLVRPLRGNEHDKIGRHAENVSERKPGMLHPSIECVQSIKRDKHAVGGEAFLRETRRKPRDDGSGVR